MTEGPVAAKGTLRLRDISLDKDLDIYVPHVQVVASTFSSHTVIDADEIENQNVTAEHLYLRCDRLHVAQEPAGGPLCPVIVADSISGTFYGQAVRGPLDWARVHVLRAVSDAQATFEVRDLLTGEPVKPARDAQVLPDEGRWASHFVFPGEWPDQEVRLVCRAGDGTERSRTVELGRKDGFVDVEMECGGAGAATGAGRAHGQPLLSSGSAFVPLRAVFEWLGAEVSFEDGEITAQTEDIELRMRPGSREASRNGRETGLSATPFIDDGPTYVPLRFVAESLGTRIEYDGEAGVTTIPDGGRSATIAVQTSLSGSLAPFPQSLSALKRNPKAYAVARAVSSDHLQMGDYASEGSHGWHIRRVESHGPYVYLLARSDLSGWWELLRREGSG